MKKLFAALLVFGIFGNMSVLAGDDHYEKEAPKEKEDREVIYYDFDLELELENGVVEAEWDDFDGEGFDWYKLVYSTSNATPVYPHDKTVFVGSEEQTEASFKLTRGKNYHYIRICAIVLNDDYSKDRYCSDVQKLETSDEDFEDGEEKEKEYIKKKYEEKKYEEKKYEEKKYDYTEKKEAVKKSTLSESMKNRIDGVIESFIEKLEGKSYTDAQMTSAINTVIQRLGEFKNKAGYTDIVQYMIVVLEEYREEYSNSLEELESIFDGL